MITSTDLQACWEMTIPCHFSASLRLGSAKSSIRRFRGGKKGTDRRTQWCRRYYQRNRKPHRQLHSASRCMPDVCPDLHRYGSAVQWHLYPYFQRKLHCFPWIYGTGISRFQTYAPGEDILQPALFINAENQITKRTSYHKQKTGCYKHDFSSL